MQRSWPDINVVVSMISGADAGRGERGSCHGQIFSTVEYFALPFLKLID